MFIGQVSKEPTVRSYILKFSIHTVESITEIATFSTSQSLESLK